MRVIPMSAELFHVIARHTAGGQAIAAIPRYDTQDKIWSAPMPHLFQRQVGLARTVIAVGTIVFWLRNTCAQLAETNLPWRRCTSPRTTFGACSPPSWPTAACRSTTPDGTRCALPRPLIAEPVVYEIGDSFWRGIGLDHCADVLGLCGCG